MKQITYILFLFISFLSFGQNKIDAKGLKQGSWEKTHPNSKALLYKGQFKDDKPIGKFTYYYSSAKIQAVIIHSKTGNNGTRSSAVFYNESGIVMSKGIYRNMKKDSIWLSYTPSGRLSSSETYKGDILNGTKIVYYLAENVNDKCKKVASVCNYENGKLQGEKIEYFESEIAAPKMVNNNANLTDSARHSNYLKANICDEYGLIKSRGTYSKDVKVGVWILNHPNGILMNQERYKNGVLHGWCTVNNETGTEIAKSYFYYGERLEGKKLEVKMKQFKELGINPNN